MILCKVRKILTKNDSCDCSSHQAGISIPPIIQDTDIFPVLSPTIYNHTISLTFIDRYGIHWDFQYKYYNSRLFGTLNGHNEHRLTCTTEFVNRYEIHTNDEVWFSIDDEGNRYIDFRHCTTTVPSASASVSSSSSVSTASTKTAVTSSMPLPLSARKATEEIDTSFFDDNDDNYVIELSGKWKKLTHK